MPGLTNVRSIESGRSNFCATHYDGTLSCWGANGFAQLGKGDFGNATDAHSPVKIAGITDSVRVSMADLRTCVVHESGDVSCWGYESAGYELMGASGSGSYVVTPALLIDVSADADAAVVGADVGSSHICVQYADHISKCWGNDYYQQLGDGGDNDPESSLRTVRNG